jgi:proteasome lid subunit RPN8/RPN11
MVDEIIGHALEEMPNECCGVVAAEDGVAVKMFKARNVFASPKRYMIDPQDQIKIQNEIDAKGWTLEAIYHSHTRSPAEPSQTDINEAELWSGTVVFLIVSLERPDQPDLRGFRIIDGRVDEVELSIT